ncbi:MAG: GIY-YIG nuclease family protein, partial [Chitinophagales bacterium]|nr:GIY-YIG nuclease family protein [Chitinophagales bacterium]
DGSYYVGITNDIVRRLYEHNSSRDEKSYTYRLRPVYLVFYQEAPDPNQAIALEKQIKGWTRKKKEALIKRNWEKFKELAACQNDSHFKNFVRQNE